MANEKYYGTGRRKSSVARVYVQAGSGKITVNGRDVKEYFPYETLILDLKQPLALVQGEDKYDIVAFAQGGGSKAGYRPRSRQADDRAHL